MTEKLIDTSKELLELEDTSDKPPPHLNSLLITKKAKKAAKSQSPGKPTAKPSITRVESGVLSRAKEFMNVVKSRDNKPVEKVDLIGKDEDDDVQSPNGVIEMNLMLIKQQFEQESSDSESDSESFHSSRSPSSNSSDSDSDEDIAEKRPRIRSVSSSDSSSNDSTSKAVNDDAQHC